METNRKETTVVEAPERKGSALRQALTPIEPLKLPSNFAHVTLRRIEREQQARERREGVVAIATIAVCLLLGLTAIGFFYGQVLLAAFQTMCHQSESLTLIPPTAFCFFFLALLNNYLRQRHT